MWRRHEAPAGGFETLTDYSQKGSFLEVLASLQVPTYYFVRLSVRGIDTMSFGHEIFQVIFKSQATTTTVAWIYLLNEVPNVPLSA